MKRRVCQRCGRSFLAGIRSTAKYCGQGCRANSRSDNPARFYKHGVYKSKSGRYEHYDSAFEEEHMKMLDAKGVKWFRADTMSIPYWNPRLRRHAVYHPDFLIKSKTGDIIQELKPYSLINDQVVQAKAEAARKWCREHGYTYEIICSPGQV